MPRTYPIDIDLQIPKTTLKTPYITQNDSVTFVVQIFDGGEPYAIDINTIPALTTLRADQAPVTVQGDITGANELTFELGPLSTGVDGPARSTVMLYGEDGRTSTLKIPLLVLKDDSQIAVLPNEKTLIEIVLEQGPVAVQQALDAASAVNALNEDITGQEATRASAEQTRQSQEQARENAESQRDQAEESRSAAELSRGQSEQTRQTQETARQNAEQLRVQGEQGREQSETSRVEAEQTRASAEQSRENAEEARAQAEESRVEQNQERMQEFDAAVETTRLDRKGTLANDAALAAITGQEVGWWYRILSSATVGGKERVVRWDGTTWVTLDEKDASVYGDLAVQLADKVTYLDLYRKPKNGMNIVMVGDSTTEVAAPMYNRFNVHNQVGGLVEGATFYNRGSNGNTLNKFVNGMSTNGYNINTVINEFKNTANLFVISYGINDIRAGIASPGRTPAQIKADMKILLDRLLSETKAYILLRIPNTFLSTDPTLGNYLDDIAKAQKYTDELFNIYESFRGYDKRIDVIDMQSLVFGRRARRYHPFIKDTLHPSDDGYRAIADEIAYHISTRRKDIEKDLKNDDVSLKGYVVSHDSQYLELLSKDSNFTIEVGDVVIVNNNETFIIDESPQVFGYKIKLKHNGRVVSTVGKVEVIKRKPQFFKLEDFKKDALRYKFNGNAGGTSGFLTAVIDISSLGLTGIQDVEFEFDTFTEYLNAKTVYTRAYLNNNYSILTITGGTSSVLHELPFESGKALHYKSSGLTVDVTGQSAFHVYIQFASSDIPPVNFEIFLKNLKVKIGGIEVVTDNKTSLYPYNSAATELEYLVEPRKENNDWTRVTVSKVADPKEIKVIAVLPISGLGLSGLKNVRSLLNYFTQDTRITKIRTQVRANNSATTINVAGSTVLSTDLNVLHGRNIDTKFHGNTKIDVTGYSYLHVEVVLTVSENGTDFKFEIGDIQVVLDDVVISYPNNTDWYLYQGDAGFTLTEGAYRRTLEMNYERMRTVLANSGVVLP